MSFEFVSFVKSVEVFHYDITFSMSLKLQICIWLTSKAGFAYIKSNPSKNVYDFKGCLIKITLSYVSIPSARACTRLGMDALAHVRVQYITIICRVVTFIG